MLDLNTVQTIAYLAALKGLPEQNALITMNKRARRSAGNQNSTQHAERLPSTKLSLPLTKPSTKFELPLKKNVDSLIKDLEKELSGVQAEVLDGFNKLERKIQCFRKPKSQLIIEQKNNCAEKHLEQLIIEMEIQQLAESII